MSTTTLSNSRNDQGAPSLMRDDDLFVPRFIGVVAAAAVIFGAVALFLQHLGRTTAVGAGWSSFILGTGIIGLLFHAAFDRDIQFRRVYMVFGYLAMGVGAFLCVLPSPNRAGDQFGPGFMCITLGLLFVLCFLRHETEIKFRDAAFFILTAAGGIMAVFGLFGGLLSPDLLIGNKDVSVAPPMGLLLALLGLVYLISAVTLRGTADETAYRIGQLLGLAGAFVFVVALVASLWPSLLWFTRKNANYFMPSGLLLQILGVLYVLAYLFLCSDNRLVVLTRRELGSFFYSPIAYLVLFSFVLAHWIGYSLFMLDLVFTPEPMPEPIVRGFIIQWASIFWTVFGVPAITMRLLAEEHKAGTLEQTLTAPVDEWAIVVSKFFAAFIMFLVTWVPFALYMVALRIEGGQPFDYRPLFSFGVGLFLTGSAFISVGLFFSSVTKNQIIAGVLTFGVMLFLTLDYFGYRILSQDQLLGPNSLWVALMKHISYIDVWIDTLNGKLVPKFLLFPLSATIVFLFLSVKVLESRKWK